MRLSIENKPDFQAAESSYFPKKKCHVDSVLDELAIESDLKMASLEPIREMDLRDVVLFEVVKSAEDLSLEVLELRASELWSVDNLLHT